ncbi:hypothetical protein [Pyruvatibacter mobilis]|uniref:hypothetical protein n=1 Tax=Pyruvatibacter mobilis TaxID=1712261 RepID=UPI003BAA368C
MTDQTEMEMQAEASPESSSSAGAPDIEVPDFEPEAPTFEAGEGEEATPDRMTKDAFFGLFCGLWTMPNMALLMAGEKPLDALNVSAKDAGAREASDALYDTIADIPAMQWLLNPASEWMQRVFVIGSFVAPRVMGAVSEFQARKETAAPSRPAQADEPANDDIPAVPSGPIIKAEPID